MSRTFRPLVVCLALGLFWGGVADAQPVDPYAAPPAAPGADRPDQGNAAQQTPPPDVERARQQAQDALTRASRSRELATCLRPAAMRVDVAARALKASRNPEQREKREAALEQALGAMRGCYDKLFEGSGPPVERCGVGLFEGDGPGKARCLGTPTARVAPLRGRTGFGQIRVAQGTPDATSVGAALRDRISLLQACQDEAIARSGAVQGEIDIGLVLPPAAAKATPFGVALRNVRVGDRPMHRCIAHALMTTSFPTTPRGALVDLRLLLTTEPAPGPRVQAARP